MIRRWTMVWISLCVMGMATYGAPGVIAADESEAVWVSKVVSIQGRVLTKRQGESNWTPVQLNDTFVAGDQVHVEANSRAGIVLSNDAVLRLDQHTTLVFTEIEQQTTFVFKLLEGAANFFSRRLRSLKIITPFVNGVVEGTEFYVKVDTGQTRIDLFEGRIFAENPFGTLQLTKGDGAVAMAGSAPQRQVLVRPRESVQWALYYPPFMALGANSEAADLEASLKLSNQGRFSEAIAGLGKIDAPDRDSKFFVYRAGLLLHVGRVSEAETDIRQALELDPANGDALALEAVIAVVQNRQADALQIAREAVRLAPRSASARIALSYALQADFDLQGALQAVQDTLAQTPNSGIVWARLAELQLSMGELERGVYAARKAVELNSRTAQAHTILGFAYLTRIETQKAREAFQQAIALDSAAPLPRLGLGLAMIRDGDLKQGRFQIEIAAGLDPGNSLMRSYLGKAYFDEKRGPLDERQFAIAKALDPNDPTPWFYDAIRKQSLNRPVEALHDLQKSIELNDNRAVYRSRLLLDDDLAARTASLGRIYNDLEFQHLALIEGYKSLNADSTNYSAHRLLSDSYAAKPRHEIARVSELLQSQLFQPLNLTPVLAQLAENETSFFEGAGPAALSASEFNPLFTRNRLTLHASGLVAGNGTLGDEVTVSGLYNKVSASVGIANYQTDGFRENNDITQDLFDFFFQGSLTPNTSLQAEYRIADNETGDLTQNFDQLYSAFLRDETDAKTIRIGAHHRFSSQIEMVASYIHSDVENTQTNMTSGFPGKFSEATDGDLYEVRTDFRGDRFGITAGFSYMDGDIHQDWRVTIAPGFELPLLDNVQSEFSKKNIYAYSNLDLFDDAVLTIGLGTASMEVGEQIDQQQLNPKIGLTLQPFAHTTLRMAAFRVLSSTYVSSQTVEPTHVAGFSQFFDDLDGTDVRSYGVALDQKFSTQWFGGLEYRYRDLHTPQFLIDTSVKAEFYDWDERTGLAYLYWAPIELLSLRAEYQYEQFDRKENPIGSGIVDIETHRVPLSVQFFHSLGISFKIIGTYFFQDGEFTATEIGDTFSGKDDFWVFDTELSYRLPKRFGVISVGVKNIFDEEFKYKDTDPSNPAVVPKFHAFGKITLSF